MHNYDNEEDYEPTQEEWDEIEEIILREEAQETKEQLRDHAADIMSFSSWCKENGILW